MNTTIDLDQFRNLSNLELCLSLVEDAYQDLQKGNHDMVEPQLRDILETFDRLENYTEDKEDSYNILLFPNKFPRV